MRFSEMDKETLTETIRQLEQEEKWAREHGLDSQVNIISQKRKLARSYLVDPATIPPKRWYAVEGETRRFYVDYLNGVMAWGNWEGTEELIALPLAVLKS
ncbi:hypothetical protein C1X05_14330 [Laceyella sacchari]|uniref:DUF1811 family protein n=1 Tax=Laceyella tengchongensis TaxID=574699 RepID=A0AA46AG05_9BACL|nr:DUF1811 family protein [Laceyella tengchongensis]AUS09883.1 hypothetical protein C1X05_14330 [Laceyella sacchari]SMP23111.1 Protein of unknown function [Laceyella tengchongensis]